MAQPHADCSRVLTGKIEKDDYEALGELAKIVPLQTSSARPELPW
jgi:hypothetical protein